MPLIAAVFVARVGTRVDERGITVRALAGSRTLTWDQMRGLTIVERNVYAVVDGGLVRLSCVRISDLHEVSASSGGRLPEVARPTPKFAPSRRKR